MVLGITGGIGSGKSTVSELFRLLGVPVYIADVESKRLVASSPIIREKLIKLFGKELYKENVLNKALLASHIFNDKNKLDLVNSIIHPEVEKDFGEWVARNEQCAVVAQEAAILFESGFDRLMDKIVTVYTPMEDRIKRVMKRDGIASQLVLERIKNQMPDEEKVKLSDYVVVNDGTLSLIQQVQDILHYITKDRE